MIRRALLLAVTVILSFGAVMCVAWLLDSPASVRAQACETISQDIPPGPHVWDQACYEVTTTTVTILPTTILSISPPPGGMLIKFADDARLQVLGKLHANGTSDDLITFTSMNANCTQNDWVGISLDQNSIGSYIDYAVIECARTGVKINDTNNVTITHNVFRMNGDSDTYAGAIGGDTDNAVIHSNTIYSCTNGIILNESFDNQVYDNQIYDIENYGLAFIEDATRGGSTNELYNNEVYRCGSDGLRLEFGDLNKVRDNDIYDNGGVGVTFDKQSNGWVQSNRVYSNATASGIVAGVMITNHSYNIGLQYNRIFSNGSSLDSYIGAVYVGVMTSTNLGSGSIVANSNVIYDAFGMGVHYASDNINGSTIMQNNAICALSDVELRNARAAHTIDARYGWWSTNTPLAGVNYAGSVDIMPHIALSITGDAEGLVTVTMSDSVGHAPPLPAVRQTSSAGPNPRRITLSSNWGSFNPSVVFIQDDGEATAAFVPGTGVAPDPVVFSATDFCGYVVTNTLQLPDLVITKTALVTSAPVGDIFAYRIDYANQGKASATQITITDHLPIGMVWVADTAAPPWTRIATSHDVMWTFPSLSPGAKGSFMVSVTVETTAACGLPLTNLAVIEAKTLEARLDNNEDSAEPVEILYPDLQIIKEADVTHATPGELITYTLWYANTGDALAEDVRITDTMPTEVAYVSGGCRGTQLEPRPGIVVWELGDLSPSEVGTCYVVGRISEAVDCGTAELSPNAVEISTVTPECYLSDNRDDTSTDSVTLVWPDVVITKTTTANPAEVFAGESVSFTIAYRNVGDAPAEGVVIRDTLPAGMRYVRDTSGLPCSGCAAGSAGPLIWTVPGLLSHNAVAELSFALVLQIDSGVPSSTTLTNTVRITTATTECVISNNEDSASVHVLGGSDLVVIKDDDVGPLTNTLGYRVGDEISAEKQSAVTRILEAEQATQAHHREFVFEGDLITYTIPVVNVGPQTVTHVILTETLPLYTEYVGYGWTRVNSRTYTQALGTLPPNYGDVVYFVVRVTDTLPAGINNIVNHVCGWGNEPDLTPDDNCNWEDTPVRRRPFLSKTSVVSRVIIGGSLTQTQSVRFTIAYSNPNNAPLAGVYLTDTVPPYTRWHTDTAETVGWTRVRTHPQVTWYTPTLAPGVEGSFVLSLAITPTRDICNSVLTNTITMTVRNAGINYFAASDSATFTVVCDVDLTVVKDDDVGPTTPHTRLSRDKLAADKLAAVDRILQLEEKRSPAAVVWQHREFVFEGDLITYTIAVMNTGDFPATNVMVSETLPLYTEYVGYDWTHHSGRIYRISVGTLRPNEGRVYYFVVRVIDPLPADVNNIVNHVCVWGDEPDVNPDDNCNWEDTPVRQRPVLTKTAPVPYVTPGDIITFTIAYHNPNDVAFTDVWLVDWLPPYSTWHSDTALANGWVSRTLLNNQVRWYTPTLSAGARGSFSLGLRVSPPPRLCNQRLTNTLTMTVKNADEKNYPVAWDTAVFTITCDADLIVIKDDDVGPTDPSDGLDVLSPEDRVAFEQWRQIYARSPQAVRWQHREFVYEGDLVTYTISVFNAGPMTATHIILRETIPAYTTYVERGFGWVLVVGGTNVTNRTYTMSVGSLAPGTGIVTYMVVRVDDPLPDGVDNLVNHICGWANEPDPNPDNNCNYEDTPVRRRPLRISKSAPRCIGPGDYFNYTPHYTNTSQGIDYTNVMITDTLPQYVVYAGSDADPWGCSGGFCYTTVPSLPAGATRHRPLLPVRLLPTVPRDTRFLTNVIEISGGYRFTLTHPLDTGPDLAVVKNDNVGPLPRQALWEKLSHIVGLAEAHHPTQQREFVRPGERITYTILYANTGLATAHNVVLTETLPEHTRYVGYGWTPVGGGQYIINLGTLDPGQGGELEFVVEVDRGCVCALNRVINVIEIAGDEEECDTSNNSSNDDTPVRNAGLLYVTNRDSNSVDVFNTYDFSYITSIDVGSQPFGMVAYEDRLYVANFKNSAIPSEAPETVSIVDLHTNQVVDTVTAGSGPLLLAALDGYIYVTNHDYDGEGITVIDHEAGEVIARLRLDLHRVYDWGFFGITSDPIRHRLYATKHYMEAEGLWSITPSLSGPSFTMNWEVNVQAGLPGTHPYYTLYHPETDHIYVTYPHINQVDIYDPDDYTLLDTCQTQQQAEAPDLSSTDGGKGLVGMGPCVYNANFAARSVTLIPEGNCCDESVRQVNRGDMKSPSTVIQPNRNIIYLPLLVKNWDPSVERAPSPIHISVNGRPKGLAAGSGCVYVALPEENRVAVIDVRVGQVIHEIHTPGRYPQQVLIVNPPGE